MTGYDQDLHGAGDMSDVVKQPATYVHFIKKVEIGGLEKLSSNVLEDMNQSSDDQSPYRIEDGTIKTQEHACSMHLPVYGPNV